jgi:GR25 family glycosyltransferase involved in LPS biosynthesis
MEERRKFPIKANIKSNRIIFILIIFLYLFYHFNILHQLVFNADFSSPLHGSSFQFQKSSPQKTQSQSQPRQRNGPSIPAFYINLNSAVRRKAYTEELLTSMGFTFQRVSAWNAEAAISRVITNVTSAENLWRPKFREIGCIASHLEAIYKAVQYSQQHPEIPPYALILEDDISFEFQIDFNELIKNTPENFTMIQLATSNHEAMKDLWWQYYYRMLKDPFLPDLIQSKTLHLRTAPFRKPQDIPSPIEMKHHSNHLYSLRPNDAHAALWSTQAYLIHTKHIASLINQHVQYNQSTHQYHVIITKPENISCEPVASMFCLLPWRIVADMYLYAMYGPTYSIHLPIINGASKNPNNFHENSFIQSNEANEGHQESFYHISELVDLICNKYRDFLPSYLSCYESNDIHRVHGLMKKKEKKKNQKMSMKEVNGTVVFSPCHQSSNNNHSTVELPIRCEEEVGGINVRLVR